jgi:hypothetical protein
VEQSKLLITALKDYIYSYLCYCYVRDYPKVENLYLEILSFILFLIYCFSGGKTGRQIVVIAGTGFDDSAVVTICGETCQQTLVTTSSYTCKTPASLGQIISYITSFLKIWENL